MTDWWSEEKKRKEKCDMHVHSFAQLSQSPLGADISLATVVLPFRVFDFFSFLFFLFFLFCLLKLVPLPFYSHHNHPQRQLPSLHCFTPVPALSILDCPFLLHTHPYPFPLSYFLALALDHQANFCNALHCFFFSFSSSTPSSRPLFNFVPLPSAPCHFSLFPFSFFSFIVYSFNK